MRNNIVTHFFSVMSMLVITSIGALGVMFMFLSNKYFQTDRLNTMNLCVVNAESAFNDSIEGDENLTIEEKRSRLRENLRLISNTTSTVVLLADENGKCIVCTEKGKCEHEGSFIQEDIMKELTSTKQSVSFDERFKDMYEGSYYTVGRAARDKYDNIVGFVFAFSDASSITMFSDAILAIFMISAGIMLLLSSIVSIVVAKNMTIPILNISDAAKRFSQGDFSARVKVEGDDEVAYLSSTFNQMASFVERNEKSRSSFVANIAHELRTPMTSIKGFVDGIIDGTIPAEKQGEYLRVISEEVGRLARLTNSMLNISKLESGEFQMNVENYNIWDTIATIAFSFENRIESANISLIGFEPHKLMVHADKDLIHQVVYNIFDNALKFTPENGYIAFNVTEDKNTGFVTVKIRNSGNGISKEALPYVFERFYKEDRSRSVHIKGAGIGLYIAKTLVQNSGGEIRVESEEGQYTEFIFTVPAAKIIKQSNSKNSKSINSESKKHRQIQK